MSNLKERTARLAIFMDVIPRILHREFTLLLLLLGMIAFQGCEKDSSSVPPCKEHEVPDCAATMQYDPVCGCNGKTYGNPSMAECSGIENYTPGKCPSDR